MRRFTGCCASSASRRPPPSGSDLRQTPRRLRGEPLSVCYLDVQDEITDAVARLRAAPDRHVVVVLPPGSRIGTSRINFRLLQRQAAGHGVSLDVVAGDAEVRALASAAGLRA